MIQLMSRSFFKSAIPKETSPDDVQALLCDISFSNLYRTWIILFAALSTGICFLGLRLLFPDTINAGDENGFYIVLNIALILVSSVAISLIKTFNINAPEKIRPVHIRVTHFSIFCLLIIMFIAAGIELATDRTFSRGVTAFFAVSILLTSNWKTVLFYFASGILASVTTVTFISDNPAEIIFAKAHILLIITISVLISRAIYMTAVNAFFVRRELEKTNDMLTTEVKNRLNALEALKTSNETLEQRVRDRTENLEHANRLLKNEITEHQLTETALRQTEAQSRALIEKMNDGFAVFNKDHTISYANDKLCEILEITKSNINGTSVMDYVPEENRSELQLVFDQCYTGQKYACEVTFVKGNGQQVNAFVSPEPLYDEDGCINGSFSVITDITAIKKMEDALRVSEEMSRALLNASGDVVMMLSTDGTILTANDSASTVFSTNRARLPGMNIFSFFSKSASEDFRQALSRSAHSKQPDIAEAEYGNFEFNLHIYPVIDGKSRVERLAVFARDVTSLKKAEKHINSLSQELIKVQEKERLKISRDLHDNVAQDLASLKIGCDTLFSDTPDMPRNIVRTVERFSRILQQSIMSIRNMAYDLRPPGLDQLGLVSTLGRFCEDFSDRHLIRIDYYSAGVSELNLTTDAEINLYRLVQEALNNIVKHADATHVTIRLITSHPTILLKIEDDGKGFDVKRRKEEAILEKRMGIQSMEERAALLDGTIRFSSQDFQGTRISVELPLKNNILHNPDTVSET